jgi:hypothetical protein
MRLSLARTATLLVIAASSNNVVADLSSIENMPLPAGAELQLVGIDIEQNGSRVSIAKFMSPDDLQQILGFYQGAWQAEGNQPGHVFEQVDEWSIIARLSDGTNLALQLTPDGTGGTSGLVSALDVNDAGNYSIDPPAMPPGASVLSTTGTQDGPKRARTWMLRAPGRPSDAALFYRDRLARDNWKVMMDRSDSEPAIVLFSNSSGTLEVVATSDSEGTFVVVNQVDTGS